MNGLTFGFSLGSVGGQPVPAKRNCPTAYEKPKVIDAYSKEELKHGSIAGPFQIAPLKRAYRLLPVREDDRHLLGMRWKGNCYIDLALPFSLRSAPQIFNRFGDVLQPLFEQQGIKAQVQHYLDDYFLVGRPNTTECGDSLRTCFEMCSLLGVPLADDKTDGPSTVITFLWFST